MKPSIKLLVGLSVLYFPPSPAVGAAPKGKAAIVTEIFTQPSANPEDPLTASGLVNLAWFEADGTTQRATSVNYKNVGQTTGWVEVGDGESYEFFPPDASE